MMQSKLKVAVVPAGHQCITDVAPARSQNHRLRIPMNGRCRRSTHIKSKAERTNKP